MRSVKYTALLIPILVLGATAPVLAQETPKTVPAADPQAVRRDLYDLSLLHSLQGMNFTEEQIKNAKDAVDKAFEKDKERRKKDDDALRAIANEVKSAHDKALDGAPLPTDLETRIAELQKASTARAAAARREATESILTILWPTLTSAQRIEADKQSTVFYGGQRVPAAYRNDPKKAPKEEVQKLAVGAFIENVLLDERTPALLAALKPNKASSAADDK